MASINPEIPPIVNKHKNPTANKEEGQLSNKPYHNVANQLNILMPVGIAIIIVVAVKYARASVSKPTVNI